ncbi:MAG: lysine--tRNA ligase [Thermoplasmata archaeon]|nr:MAG: lysine--tRNA ligase [Thermoplasmata archaeon]
MHWADVIAEDMAKRGEKHIIATGITPSGPIHIGNMREILTGDLVARAARERGLDATLIYIGDTFDPLRRVYPFLPPEYSQYVGMPLSEIPCPCSSHSSYAEHFLEPFLKSLQTLGIDAEVLLSHEMYRKKMYSEAARRVIENRERIREILTEVSGRELPPDWFPYIPRCSACGRLNTTTATGYSHPFVSYRCKCGYEGKADIRTDGGKLPWRVDWPSRWWFLNVTVEPFGKDHAAAGGSYDTASRIVREVFGREPPYPVVYEWIQLKGKGAMSSSKGIAISAVEMLKMTPPEVLRYLVARTKPFRHIDFDPGMGILNLVDDYERAERIYFGLESGEELEDIKRAYELSLVDPSRRPERPLAVPYRHLVTLVQIKPSFEEILKTVKRTELSGGNLTEEDTERIRQRAEAARYWLDRYAPESLKITLYEEPPERAVKELDEEAVEALEVMREALLRIPWDAEEIHNTVYEASRAHGIDPRKTFQAFYLIFLGSRRGPRLGYFLSTMRRAEVLRRIERALEMVRSHGKG